MSSLHRVWWIFRSTVRRCFASFSWPSFYIPWPCKLFCSIMFGQCTYSSVGISKPGEVSAFFTIFNKLSFSPIHHSILDRSSGFVKCAAYGICRSLMNGLISNANNASFHCIHQSRCPWYIQSFKVQRHDIYYYFREQIQTVSHLILFIILKRENSMI